MCRADARGMRIPNFAAVAVLAVAACSPSPTPGPTAANQVDAALMNVGLDAQPQASSQAAIPPATDQARAPLASELPDFTALVDRYGDAVVNVEVVGRAEPS